MAKTDHQHCWRLRRCLASEVAASLNTRRDFAMRNLDYKDNMRKILTETTDRTEGSLLLEL
jgi:hypothetical protein